eukprot:CAMPEP_0182860514 /NCGR_PEP_ID=MMETSP0034_2-20130328/4963_1 /TAXON_ID=156128 /ORGANISM="Nephroselmis pyriformis, Strain CCMP717" /LENGTH=34 /DNA_ID= /DNA_START= /DNA_END= /DNA_ORIENTATION=
MATTSAAMSRLRRRSSSAVGRGAATADAAAEGRR